MIKINKLIIIIMMLTLTIISIHIPVYGEQEELPAEVPPVEESPAEETTEDDSGGASGSDSWLQDAFSAAGDFLTKEDLTTTDIHIGDSTGDDGSPGIIETMLATFRTIVKALNTILLVVLAGLSIISLAITGIRYIMSQGLAEKQVVAKENLHTVFRGMFFGFGAFFIWKIAMSIVQVVIQIMAN